MLDAFEAIGRQLRELSDHLVQTTMRCADLERRLDNTVRHGPVTDVDTKKQLCRIEVARQDGEVMKSPWIPYGQIAGDLKVHTPPVVGQQLTVVAPNGEMRQALALPLTWSDKFKSPGDSADPVITYKDKVKLTVQDGKVVLKVGDTEQEWAEKNVNITAPEGGAVRTIGPTLLGMDDKNDSSAPKVGTESGPAKKAKAKV